MPKSGPCPVPPMTTLLPTRRGASDMKRFMSSRKCFVDCPESSVKGRSLVSR